MAGPSLSGLARSQASLPAPLARVSSATLYALDGRGFAENARVMLAAAGVRYEEVAVETRAQREALFANPSEELGLPPGVLGPPLAMQLPLLVLRYASSETQPVPPDALSGGIRAAAGSNSEESVLCVASAGAIVRHLARACGLYGDGEQEAARIDMLAEGVGQLCSRFVALPFASVPLAALHGDDDWRDPVAELRARHLDVVLPQFDRVLAVNGASQTMGWLVGARMSYVDILLTEVVEYVQEYCPGTADDYPLLRALWQRVRGKPRLKAFFDGDDGHRKPPSGRHYVATVRAVMG